MERPRHVVILAGTHGEAWRYAKAVGLRSYRIATRPQSVRNTKVADIHELPSFAARRDRHAILAELKWTKGERYMVTMPQPAPREISDEERFGWDGPRTVEDLLTEAESLGAEVMHHVVTNADEAALTEAFNHALVGHAAESLETLEQDVAALPLEPDTEETDGQTGETQPSEDPAPDEEPRRRTRRRRCAECGELVPPDAEHSHGASAPAERDFF